MLLRMQAEQLGTPFLLPRLVSLLCYLLMDAPAGKLAVKWFGWKVRRNRDWLQHLGMAEQVLGS